MAERRSRRRGASIIHKGDLNAKVGEAQEILGVAKRFHDDLRERINRLARHYPSRRKLEVFYETLNPDQPESETTRAENIRKESVQLFEHGSGQNIPATMLTNWAAFNALTEWVDHHRSTRGRTDQERTSRRLESAWFGSGAKLKSDASTAALAMAG